MVSIDQTLLDITNPYDQNLLNILNLGDKGSDVVVLHIGSHSLKFGLASQLQPFIIPNAIAYRLRETEEIKRSEEIIHEKFENELDQVETNIRDNGVLIEKALKKGKEPGQLLFQNKTLNYKLYDSSNSLSYLESNQPKVPSLLLKNSNKEGKKINQAATSTALNDKDQDFVRNDNLSNVFTASINENLSNNNYQYTYIDPENSPSYLVGEDALNIHPSAQYRICYPIKYGYFNITDTQSHSNICDSLEKIIEYAITMRLRIPRRNFVNFSVVLGIPDIFNRKQLKLLTNIMMKRFEFKSIFLQQESVLSTFALALPTACVIDIGSQKINVCCVDEGAILPNTTLKKNYGGDDINYLLYHLLKRRNTIHYFPRDLFLDRRNYYHMRIIERVKETYCAMVPDQTELIKTCKLWNHEDKTAVLTFNSSDALIMAPYGLFHPELFKAVYEKEKQNADNIYMDLFYEVDDPEDIAEDYMQSIFIHFHLLDIVNVQPTGAGTGVGGTPATIGAANGSSQKVKPDDSYKPSPRQKDETAKMQDIEEEVVVSTENPNSYSQMMSYASLETLVCESVCKVEDPEVRKKLANSILLVGGSTKFKGVIDTFEEKIMNLFLKYDENIERVEVLINSQKDYDSRFLTWIGGSIMPKLESAKDLFITREKWNCEYIPYEESTAMDMFGSCDSPRSEVSTLKNETKRTKLDRNIEGGIKVMREKSSFMW